MRGLVVRTDPVVTFDPPWPVTFPSAPQAARQCCRAKRQETCAPWMLGIGSTKQASKAAYATPRNGPRRKGPAKGGNTPLEFASNSKVNSTFHLHSHGFSSMLATDLVHMQSLAS